MKIIPSGSPEMELSSATFIDEVIKTHIFIYRFYSILFTKLGKSNYMKPKPKKLTVVNRNMVNSSSNIKNHMNDIYEYIFQQNLYKIGYIAGNIMLIVDGGPDYSVGSWLNLYYYGLLWQESKLDQLFVVSHAPYHSKYRRRNLFI